MKNGYILPLIPDVADTVCFQIEVPNRPEYLLAFKGQIDMLGYWWLWERDELKQGRTAAELWRIARGTLCMSENCIPIVPAIPPDITPTASGSNVIDWTSSIITTIIEGLDDGDADVTIISRMTTLVGPMMPGRDCTTVCKLMLKRVKEASPAEKASWPIKAWKDSFYLELGCDAEPDGSFLDIAAALIADWLEAAGDWVSDTLAIVAADLYGPDWTRASTVGGDGSGGYGGGPNACVWHLVDSIVLPGAKSTFTAFTYPTVPGKLYAMASSGVVDYHTPLHCYKDSFYAQPGPCGPGVGPKWYIAFDGHSYPEAFKPEASDNVYWTEGAVGDGLIWGAKVQDVAYSDNAGQFVYDLYELN